MKQFVLDYLSQECSSTPRIATCTTQGKDADMLIDLEGGKRVAVYVVNRAIRVPEIRERLEANTRRKWYTLFIVDGRMMPGEHDQVEPPHWMSALHALSNGRVYAYWCDGRSVTIRPVHMDWKWGAGSRDVTYGPAVNLDRLRGEQVTTASKYLDGDFNAASFGETPFWKKRDPNEGQTYKYSWRQWSYAGKKQQTEEAQEPAYDPWESFDGHYGDVGGYGFFRNVGGTQQGREQARARPSTPSSQRHYALLGVSAEASFDEIKKAYRRKARENHPDLHPNEREKYTTRMAEINAAFEAISKTRLD